jgi:hypothetical protein
MTGRLVPARNPNCPARGHSRWSRRHGGCICPRRDIDRADTRSRYPRRITGPMRVTVLPSVTRGGEPVEPDRIAISRMLDGATPGRVTSLERQTAVTVLTGRGLNAREIAAVLRINSRTVARYRSRTRVGAA